MLATMDGKDGKVTTSYDEVFFKADGEKKQKIGEIRKSIVGTFYFTNNLNGDSFSALTKRHSLKLLVESYGGKVIEI